METVTWMTEDLPPTFIYDGVFAGQGTGDLAMRILFGKLPEYRHRVVRANTARIFHDMARTDGICYWGAWRSPERAKLLSFSNRPVRGPTFRLIVEKNHLAAIAPYLTPDGAVDLAALRENGGLTGGYINGQPYPGVIGDFIKDPNRKVRLEAVPQFPQLYSMLGAGRVDFIIGNGVETRYYMSLFQSRSKLTPFFIKDARSQTEGYIACSNGPIGRSVISEIDRLLADDAVWEAYLEPLRRWFDPADYAAALASKPRR